MNIEPISANYTYSVAQKTKSNNYTNNKHLQDTFVRSSEPAFKGNDDENFDKGLKVAKVILLPASIIGGTFILSSAAKGISNGFRSDFRGYSRQLEEANRHLASIDGKLGGGGG